MVTTSSIERGGISCRSGALDRAREIAAAVITARRPVRFIVSRLLRATGICRWMIIRQTGYRLHFFPTAFSATLWADMPEVSDDERFLRTFLRPGDVVIDVGANVGTHAIVSALKVGQAGRVYACEAHPTTAVFLRQNIRLNRLDSIVEVIESAIGEREGEAVVSDYRSDDQNHVTTVCADGIAVTVRTLDNLVPNRNIDLLKIDVEGFELMVLRGARRMLARTQAIYFEAWDQHFARYGYGFGDLYDFLMLHGFTVVDPHTRSPIGRTERIARCVNLLAQRQEVRN